jgi:hypothetical protein
MCAASNPTAEIVVAMGTHKPGITNTANSSNSQFTSRMMLRGGGPAPSF